MFGYVSRELVVADRRLQFGWRSSPGVFCLFSAALEHAHRYTSYDEAVVMEQGRTATEHVSVTPPRATNRPASFPPGCRVPRGRGGERRSPFFVLCYVDDGYWWRYNGGPMADAVDVRPRLSRRNLIGSLG